MRYLRPFVRRLVSAATSDRGVRLTGQLLDRMEYCFGTRLDDVRLHFSEESRAANQYFGSLAFAVDGHICFRREFHESCRPLYARLLAHEVAHVLQKRRAPDSGPGRAYDDALFEWEAHRAASHVLAERRVSNLTADTSAAPRCWGAEGHYYTVLWASLAAGLSLEAAKANAFFCQMPDQVRELDAIAAGIQWITDLDQENRIKDECTQTKGEIVIGLATAFSNSTLRYSDLVTREYDLAGRFIKSEADRQSQWQIQTGLHALTGGDSGAETKYRESILKSTTGATLEYGLGLHAFGDSFAHRNIHNEKVMYGPPQGHLFDGHKPDTIDEQRMKTYMDYGDALWMTLKTKWQVENPPVARDTFRWSLQRIPFLQTTVETGKDGKTVTVEKSDVQIRTILDLAALALALRTNKSQEVASNELLKGLYRPEKASRPKCFIQINPQNRLAIDLPETWGEFFHQNRNRTDVVIYPEYFERAQKCSREWTKTAHPFNFITNIGDCSQSAMGQRHRSTTVLSMYS